MTPFPPPVTAMPYHGWELVFVSMVGLLRSAVWPLALVFAVAVLRAELRGIFAMVSRKIHGLQAFRYRDLSMDFADLSPLPEPRERILREPDSDAPGPDC